jgi:hypothetical protein
VNKQPFAGYVNQEQNFWAKHHAKYENSILAVGRGNASISTNEREYAIAGQQFMKMVRNDFPDPTKISVLDCGFGHGHYARACYQSGVERYVGLDFASQARPKLGSNYTFRQQDLGQSFDLEQKFDLVICLDVIFHIVNDEKFKVALENIRRHASDKIYITSLFREAVFPPYVKHRPLNAYASLGATHLSRDAWRDNSISRFQIT